MYRFRAVALAMQRIPRDSVYRFVSTHAITANAFSQMFASVFQNQQRINQDTLGPPVAALFVSPQTDGDQTVTESAIVHQQLTAALAQVSAFAELAGEVPTVPRSVIP